jgi:hypothetical protein
MFDIFGMDVWHFGHGKLAFLVLKFGSLGIEILQNFVS